MKTIWKSPFLYIILLLNLNYYSLSSCKTSFFLSVCNICSNHKMKVSSSCLSTWMSLDKVRNNSLCSRRICFCRPGKLNVGASWVCHWKQAAFNMLYMKCGVGGRLMYITLSSMSRKMWRLQSSYTITVLKFVYLYVVLWKKVEGWLMHKNRSWSQIKHVHDLLAGAGCI